MNGSNGNSIETKVALLMDRSSDNHEDTIHQLRNLRQNVEFIRDEISDLEKRIRYGAYGLVLAWIVLNGDLMEIFKGLM